MNIFHSLYININKKKFLKSFKPVGIKKRANYLVSTPASIRGFLKTLPFLGELHSLGHIVLLAPRSIENLLKIIKPNLFEVLFFEKPPVVLTREFKAFKNQLASRNFNVLIELDEPANISLPFMVEAERRITFYHKNNYPFYNILVKDQIDSLHGFFQIEKKEALHYFKFYVSELKKMNKDLNKKRPLLFVNGIDNAAWEGDKVIFDKKTPYTADVYKILYLCDAYRGADDELCELAKIFNKKILSV